MHKMIIAVLGTIICLTVFSSPAVSKNLPQQGGEGKHHASNHNDKVRCESVNNRRKHCSINTHNGIKLNREFSRNRCKGNWGSDRKGVWVNNGCDATFKAQGGGHRPEYDNHRPGHDNNRPRYGEQIVQCQSVKYRKKYCDISNLKSVKLIEVLSKHTPCDGKWGYDNRGIWVDNNCKARFSYTTGGWNNNNHAGGNNHGGNNHAGGNNHGSLGQSKTLKCKSRSREKQVCARNVKKADLKREISKGKYPCRNNWGIDRYGNLYVKNNCYAEFKYWD